MSYVETLQAERKVRLARIAARGIEPVAQAIEAEPVPQPEPVEPPPVLPEPPGPVSLERIQKVVCEHFGITGMALRSERRPKSLTVPRHIVYYLAKHLTLRSFPAIGRMLGGRNHATIMHGVSKVERRMATDADFRAIVEELASQIGGSDQTENRARARLTPEKVRQIRASDDSMTNLANQFGVTRSAIWYVRNNKTWAHLNDDSSGKAAPHSPQFQSADGRDRQERRSPS